MVCNVDFAKMADLIKHKGVVVKIDGSHVVVRIVQTSACAACTAKGLCNASESKEKQVDVYETNPSYRIGEEVVVCGTTSMGMRAVLLAFGIPLLVLLIALFVTMRITDGDALVSALVALMALALNYLVIYLMRNKLEKNFSFMIEKQ